MILLKFFGEIFLSACDPFFFRKIIKKSTGRAFGYYFFFTTLHTLVICAVGLWFLSTLWDPALNQLRKVIPSFEARITQGHLSTTLPEPVALGDSRFAFILDTTGRTNNLLPFKSAVFVSETKAIVKKNSFETREYNFSALPDFSITSSDVLQWLGHHQQTILWSIFSLMAFLILPTLWLMILPAILFLILIAMIPMKLVRSRLSYSEALSIGLYAVTLPTLLQTYTLVRGFTIVPWIYAVYFGWVLVGLIMAGTGKEPAEPPSITTTPGSAPS
jgi:hypothetical protein